MRKCQEMCAFVPICKGISPLAPLYDGLLHLRTMTNTSAFQLQIHRHIFYPLYIYYIQCIYNIDIFDHIFSFYRQTNIYYICCLLYINFLYILCIVL